DANGSQNSWFKSKVGIGTYNPEATLDLHGSFKLVDGNQGEGKVLTSDSKGNATWKSLNNSATASNSSTSSSNEEVFADLYMQSSQNLSNGQNAIDIQFSKSYFMKNTQLSNNGIQVKQAGIFEANATISIRIDDDDAENAIIEFYLAKWGNKIASSSVFLTIDSAVKDGEIYTVSLNKLVKLNQWEQIAVYAKKYNNRGKSNRLSILSDSSNFNLKKIGSM
ncbi:hypothetical protein, partial [Zunongwangia sp.]|uniref:hypothetical protein n=1 Tax=Zunongwangia sp. TaxID=1965325 RepID=UPI003AA7CA2A